MGNNSGSSSGSSGGTGTGRNLDADMAAGSSYFNQFNTGGSSRDRDRAIEQLESRPDSNIPVLGSIANYSRDNQLDKLRGGGSPVFDDSGRVQGVYSNTGLFGGRVYSGNPEYGPNPPSSGGSSDNDTAPVGPNPQEVALQKARDRRATALANKQRELADAFNFFNDDFYDDMSTSYRDFASNSLQSAYDDSLRGIYQGFKAKGMLSQGDVNQAIAGLDAAKQDEMSRLDRLAADYAGAKRTEVDTSRQKFGDELSALVGGATDEASINQQADNIEGFDVAGRVDKLKKPGAKSAVEFFQGYDKVSQQNAAKQNVTASAAPGQVGDGGGSASSVVQMGANTAPSSMVGIRSPFQGGSTKVLGS